MPATADHSRPGLSPAGLAQLHDQMATHVERASCPGSSRLVAPGDDVHVEVIGTRAFGDTAPLPRDAIFRIASLHEAHRRRRGHDPRRRRHRCGSTTRSTTCCPSSPTARVLRSIDAELDDTVPAKRAITVDDLLTFRLGFGTVMAPPGALPDPARRGPARAAHARSAVATDAVRPRRVDRRASAPCR